MSNYTFLRRKIAEITAIWVKQFGHSSELSGLVPVGREVNPRAATLLALHIALHWDIPWW